MLFFDVCLDTIDNCSGPFNDEGLETVLLIKVCVHILLQSLFANLVLLAFFVEFDFLRIHILNGVFELLESQNPVLGASNRSIVSSISFHSAYC